MTTRPGADDRAVTAAVRSVGLRIAAIAATIVVGLTLAAVLFVLQQSRPRELLEPAKPGQDKIYVDAHEMLLAIVLLGACAIVLAGVASALVARRAVRPLGRALELQRAFVADASHELRTPLAVLDARVQLLQRRTDADDPVRAPLGELRADVAVLGEGVTDLLDAAGAEARPTGAPLELDAAVAETVASLQVVAQSAGVRLGTALAADALVAVPAATLRRVVTALVDNAIAHSPAGSTVQVRSERRGGGVRLLVTDEGAGIVGIAPERVFDRFARATPAADAPEGIRRGFGLGLAIVRDAVERSGGRVTVASTSPEGTAFAVDLPVAARARAPRP